MVGQRHGFSDDELMGYARGTAPADLAGRIAEVAAADDMLRAEIALMRGLRQALALDDAGHPPDELGWRRLEAAIRKEPGSRTWRAPVPAVWRVAAVVAGLMVLGQGAYLLATRPGGDAAYRTATRGEVPHALGIGFRAGASIGDISALLQQSGGRIIDGPGAAGIYRIGFATEAELRAGRELLAGSTLVDLLAEE